MSTASISTGRELTFLPFESVTQEEPALADFAVVFNVLTEEWDEATQGGLITATGESWEGLDAGRAGY